jgi:hypothetical protein
MTVRGSLKDGDDDEDENDPELRNLGLKPARLPISKDLRPTQAQAGLKGAKSA